MSSTSLEEAGEKLTVGGEILSGRLGWFGKIDTTVYQLEIVVVVFALIAMSVAVFLDVVAQFVVRTAQSMTGAEGAALSDYGAAIFTLVFVAMMAYAAAGATLRHKRGDDSDELPPGSWPFQVGITVATMGFCVGLGWSIINLESSTVYQLMVGVLLILAAKHFYDRHEYKRLAGLIVVGLLGLWSLGSLPSGYSWAQSYGLFLLLWVGFLGASVAARERRHLRVDISRKLLSARWLPHFNALSYFVAAMFTGLVFYLGFIYLFGIDSSYMKPIWDAPSWMPTGLQEQLQVYPLPDDASAFRRMLQVAFAPSEPGEVPDWLKVAAIPVSMFLILIRFLGHSFVFARMAIRGEEFSEHMGVH